METTQEIKTETMVSIPLELYSAFFGLAINTEEFVTVSDDRKEFWLDVVKEKVEKLQKVESFRKYAKK